MINKCIRNEETIQLHLFISCFYSRSKYFLSVEIEMKIVKMNQSILRSSETSTFQMNALQACKPDMLDKPKLH